MAENPNDWEVATRLIRGGLARSPHGELAEPIYLTQSFAYDSAESADARFSGAEPGFIYARYGNPTVKMFEDRLALLEGAQACRATASGMSAVHMAITGLVRAGDHIVSAKALFGSCRWIMNTWAPRFGIETTLVDGPDLAAWLSAAVRAQHAPLLHREPGKSAAGDLRHRWHLPHRPRDRRQGGGR